MPAIPPPVYVASGLLAQHLLAPRDRRRGAVRTAAATAVGGLGAGMLALATLSFRRHHTTVNPISPEKASVVVDEGVFGLTRNPMYVGMTLIQTGIGVALANPWILLLLPPTLWILRREVIEKEEAYLTRRFGESYTSYQRSVRRWL